MKTYTKKYTYSREDRLQIWQEMLTREKGVTYKEFEERLDSDSLDTRKDMEFIRKLLANQNITLREEGKRNIRFFLDNKSINLCDLHSNNLKRQISSLIIDLLVQVQGVLPSGFYAEVCKSAQIKTFQLDQRFVGFDTNESLLDSFKYFQCVYESIASKTVLRITFERINNSKNLTTVCFHPEYLKQYNSIWYVLGTAYNDKGERLIINRIRLDLITNIDILGDEFIPSGLDYADYFDQIVGVDNPCDVEVEDIRFLVRNSIYNRLFKNPIHEGSQRKCSELDGMKPGYKGCRIQVKENMELIRKFLSYGNDLIVVSPPRLKNKMKKLIAKSMSNYD